MKLNYKRTVLVGLAFMSICSFWQLYDGVVPLILKNTFDIPDTIAGIVMALDNVVAFFLLPILGGFSDKCNTRIGKRKPFIIGGTCAAVLLMLLLPVFDNAYAANPSGGLMVGFVGSLALLLIAMGTYRSPAVALMPDVTPKPLRSKGNAVINLMGAVGGILYLIITGILYSSSRTEGLSHINYLPLFGIVAVIMIVCVLILTLCVDEPACAAEVAEYERNHPEDSLEEVDESTGEAIIPAPVRRSLIFLLASIALWYMGYNAVSTSFTKFASVKWNMSLGSASLCLTVGMAAAILAYIPIGEMASRIGRKKSILIGVIVLSVCFAICGILGVVCDGFTPILYVVFIFVGLSWASINVNSLPMVVEMCKGSDVGKFTGYYYSFSMAAQILTPILSGALLQYVGYNTLFPYGALFVLCSFATMLFVKHGDNRPDRVKDKMEYLGEIDMD